MWAVTTSSIAHGALGGGKSLLQRAWFPNYSFLIFLLMWRLYSRALCEWENLVSVTDVHLHSVVVACRPHVEGMYIGYDGFWASRKACWYWRCCAAAPSKERESGKILLTLLGFRKKFYFGRGWRWPSCQWSPFLPVSWHSCCWSAHHHLPSGWLPSLGDKSPWEGVTPGPSEVEMLWSLLWMPLREYCYL